MNRRSKKTSHRNGPKLFSLDAKRAEKQRGKPSNAEENPQLSVTALADDGRGIARFRGKVVFVRGALPGETVVARLTGFHKRYYEAELESVLEPSLDRLSPPCEYFQQCGGCHLQHMRYSAQLAAKESNVHRSLSKLFGEDSFQWDSPIQGSGQAYRHRVRLAIAGGALGFRRGNSHYVEDISHCLVADDAVNQAIGLLRELLKEWLPALHGSELRLAAGAGQGFGLSISLHKALAGDKVKALLADLAPHFAHVQLHNDTAGSVLQGDALLYPSATIAASAAEQSELHTAKPSPRFFADDFTQVNPAINAQLVSRVSDYLQLQGDEVVHDYFCGLGNFSLALAPQVRQLNGWESSAEMVARASAAAAEAGMSNCSYHRVDLFKPLAASNLRADAVVLDPPRAGAKSLCESLAKLPVSRIAYVSCHPASMLRDLETLRAGGYTLERACIADMFPHTKHCEALVLLRYSGKPTDR